MYNLKIFAMKEQNCTMPIHDARLVAAPTDKIPQSPTLPQVAYKMVKDETYPQTQPRLNLATFVTTYMDEYDKTAKWTLYDLQAVLQQSGWMVPAYTMPKDIEDLVVMRVVVRQGLTRDMADMLLTDIRNAVAEFDKLKYPTTSRLAYEKQEKQYGKVFTH